MSTEQERTFVEAAARVAYVTTWADREENTCTECGDDVDNDAGTTHHSGAGCRGRSFAVQKLEDVAPPTPDYAREWAWKLLGALEEINPRWGRNLASICAAAARADHAENEPLAHKMLDRDSSTCVACLTDDGVRAFGSNVALMALGTDVSWFDDHAHFELHVPDWSARGFELEEVQP